MSGQQQGSEGPGPGRGPRGRPAPADELILAALERAERHRPPPPGPHRGRAARTHTAGVPALAVAEHLGTGGGMSAPLGRRLRALAVTGEVRAASRRGLAVFSLTPAGHRRLERSGAAAALGESPQHRAWRQARAAGAEDAPRLRAELTRRLEAAAMLLDDRPPARADDWLELGEDLRRDARRLASALHCMREWEEPSDERADADTGRDPGDAALPPARRERLRVLRAGRRNRRLWQGDRP